MVWGRKQFSEGESMHGWECRVVLIVLFVLLGTARGNGNWTLGVNEELTSRLVLESSTERVLDDELKALLIARANKFAEDYRTAGFTFETCVTTDTPQSAAWCRCLTNKLARFKIILTEKFNREYQDEIAAAFDECKASTLDGTEANVGLLCSRTLFVLRAQRDGTFCCPESADMEDCSDKCVRDLMPAFCASGGPPPPPFMEDCLVSIARWKQSFHIFRDVDPLPKGSMEWCSCLEENGLPVENTSSPAFSNVFDTCRNEVLRDGTVNVVDICHGMYSLFGRDVRQTFCAPLHTGSPRRRLDCSQPFVENLMPEYCSKYRLEYSAFEKYLRDSASATVVVVDGKNIGFRQSMASSILGFDYYPRWSSRAVAEQACDMLYPGNPDACCDYARAPVLFGSCCRTEGGTQKFDCTHPETYRGVELFYHCLQSNGRYNFNNYYDFDIPPRFSSRMKTSENSTFDKFSSKHGVSASTGASESFASNNLTSRGAYNEYHFPKKACGSFISAYLGYEYGNLTLQRSVRSGRISVIIPTSMMDNVCTYDYEYSIDRPCCYSGAQFGTFSSSLGQFFAQCVETEPIPDGGGLPKPEEPEEDPCLGTCKGDQNCVLSSNGKPFCVECSAFQKRTGRGEYSECCQYDEEMKRCDSALRDSGVSKCKKQQAIVLVDDDGDRVPVDFTRSTGYVCRNPREFRKNGKGCKVEVNARGVAKCYGRAN